MDVSQYICVSTVEFTILFKIELKWTKEHLPLKNWRLPGEWMKIQCTVNVEENVTLLFNDRKLTVDNRKVKYISKNIFNISGLQIEDEGDYKCKVCEKEKSHEINISFYKRGD